ncbi:MAG: bifunctional nuclease family protein [Bacteroidota bacterium]|nr:bifunctional nuclease family protein [Bacteroidota bacterium]
MEKIKLDIIGISYSQTQFGSYALILGESNGKRRLPIIIGPAEAQSIAIAIEKIEPKRPLSHDLFKNFAESFDITVTEVIIHKFFENIFFAKLVCKSKDVEKEIDARTSDAIALAVRFGCPIYTFDAILNFAGIILEDDTPYTKPQEEENFEEGEEGEEKETETVAEDFSQMSMSQLEELLNVAVHEEAYERASRIRDEINRRKLKE